jgi:hypothetical protein
MHCKKCDAVFYMDSGGRLTLGEPPTEKPKTKKGATAGRSKDYDDPLDALKRIPKWVPWTFALACVGLLIWMSLPLFETMFTGLPKGIEARANYFATAFIEKDWKRMKKLTRGKDNQDAMLEWVKQVRPYYPDVDPTAYALPVIEFKDLSQRVTVADDPMAPTPITSDMPSDETQTEIRITPPPDPSGKLTSLPFLIVLKWKKAGDWWIDGQATYGIADQSGPGR